jgi:predicted RecA/RadA family phage recombinase
MKNFVQEPNNVKLTVGSGVVSGQPVVVGVIPAVALTDADANNQAACLLEGVFSLSVVATNNAGNSAVVEGDALYIDGSSVISKDATNDTFFGYAVGAVTSGATATINVLVN